MSTKKNIWDVGNIAAGGLLEMRRIKTDLDNPKDKRNLYKLRNGPVLKIDKRLPQIILPVNKIQMFIDWWNSDIRFEKTIPHTFNEGYLFVDNLYVQNMDVNLYKKLIKDAAVSTHNTYREIETQFKNFMDESAKLVLYFRFTSDSSMIIDIYGKDMEVITHIEFGVGEDSKPENIIVLDDMYVETDNFDDILKRMNILHMDILITCLWYIATTSRSTKYIYEKKSPVIIGRHKNKIDVSDTKFIGTPIYDMSKIRTVKVEQLSSRKDGWTYSHSFQVHGHYRHYKDGKVIFIEPYVKGKEKKFKAQKYVLTPDEY